MNLAANKRCDDKGGNEWLEVTQARRGDEEEGETGGSKLDGRTEDVTWLKGLNSEATAHAHLTAVKLYSWRRVIIDHRLCRPL